MSTTALSRKASSRWQANNTLELAVRRKHKNGVRLRFLNCRFLQVLAWFLKKLSLFVCGRDLGGRDLELLHVKSDELRWHHPWKHQDILTRKASLLALGTLFFTYLVFHLGMSLTSFSAFILAQDLLLNRGYGPLTLGCKSHQRLSLHIKGFYISSCKIKQKGQKKQFRRYASRNMNKYKFAS